MRLDNFVELLSCVPLFHGLTNEQLARLAFESEKILVYPEHTIISKDQEGDAAYLIVSGEAIRTEGSGISNEPEILTAGTFIGEMAMLIASNYGSTIIACEEMKLLKFSYAKMQSIMKQDVSLAEHFAEYTQQKFFKFTDQLNKLESDLFKTAKDTMTLANKNHPVLNTSTYLN